MASYNKIILLGNLTRDPQLSYLPSQTAAVDVGLAVNHKYKGADGQMVEKVCFVDCRAFGKTAETINQYLEKGRSLLVEGRLEFDQWEAQDGSKRSKHRVFIERFTFMDGQQDAAKGYSDQQQQQAPSPPQQAPHQQNLPPADGGAPDGSDISF